MDTELPRLSGPPTMIVWTKKETTNSEQEAHTGEDQRELREVEIMLGQGGTTRKISGASSR